MATAIVLGRAGSKGVPGKNMANVGGRPCVAWTIDAALASASIDRVVVSSDSPELLVLARSMGCEVVERPASLASDLATVDAAARHAVATIGLSGTRSPVVILYANVPVRPALLIDEAVEMLVSTNADSVQSYTTVGKHHPWWMTRVDPSTGKVEPWEGGVLNHGVYRRQDLPPAHIPDGGVIAVTRESLMLELGVDDGPHAFFGRTRRGVVTQEGGVVDIDTEADLARANEMLRTTTNAKRVG
jgi:N-acylneuraminate cytidylyltransferase